MGGGLLPGAGEGEERCGGLNEDVVRSPTPTPCPFGLGPQLVELLGRIGGGCGRLTGREGEGGVGVELSKPTAFSVSSLSAFC